MVELDEFLQELDEDVEGMQSTIIYLQQKLREAKEQLKKLQEENDLLSSNNTLYFSETNETARLNKPKVDSDNLIEDSEINVNPDVVPNHDLNRTNGDKSPSYSLPINSPRTPTHSELPSTPEPPVETRVCDSPPVVPRLNSPRTPPEVNWMEEMPARISHTVSNPQLEVTPESAASPDTRVVNEIADQPRKIFPSVGLEKPNMIHENGLKQGVICYGHQSVLVGNPPIDFKRETTQPESPIDFKRETTSQLPEIPIVDEITTPITVNRIGNQYEVKDERMETTECVTNKVDSAESFPLDLVKKSGDFTLNHSPISSVVSAPNTTEPSATNVIILDGGNLPASIMNENLSPVIVPKIRLLAAVQHNLDSNPPSASSPSPPQSPNPLPVSVSPERTKRTRPLSDDEESTNRPSDSIVTSPKKRKLMAIESFSSATPSSEVLNSPSSPSRDKDLTVDIDTEVQVAQTLACWAAASSKERARPKSPNSDQRVTGLVGNGEAVDGSKIGEGNL